MPKNFSFSHLENELAAELREKVSTSEDVTDLKNHFSYSVIRLLKRVLPETVRLNQRDVTFVPEAENHLQINPQLLKQPEMQEVLRNTDLSQVMARFALAANKRFLHLQKNTRKTKLKIRK